MIVEFVMLPLPVFCLVVKVIEWSGDYVWLSFLGATAVVELFLVWLYPRVIKPLTSAKKPMPDKYGILKPEVEKLCQRVSFNVTHIWVEQSYDMDMHANASLASDQIFLGKTLLKQH